MKNVNPMHFSNLLANPIPEVCITKTNCSVCNFNNNDSFLSQLVTFKRISFGIDAFRLLLKKYNNLPVFRAKIRHYF